MTLLIPARQRYDWGSRSLLQSLIGEDPDGAPLAELWFGTHAAGPTRLDGGSRLLAGLVTNDLVGQLGNDVISRFGEKLPYLVKLLAADRPLSIQVHPSAEQAIEGFAREDALGVALDSPMRTYRDESAKPEILVAMTPFEALCGVRPINETIAFFDSLEMPALSAFRSQLRQPDGVAATIGQLLTMAPGDQHHLVDLVGRAARRYPAGGPFSAEATCLADLAVLYPNDAGVIVAGLLNHVVLQPGEAVYLAAGNIHAYLRGAGLEVLACSDNVVRGGLTSKHVDVAELLRIADFSPLRDPVVHPDQRGRYPSTAPEFRVERVEVRADADVGVSRSGPTMLVCTRGNVGALHRGQVEWVPASHEAPTLRGVGTVFVVTVAPIAPVAA